MAAPGTEARQPTGKDERQTQREYIAAKRAAERDLVIPPPENIERRNACLANGELFLTTYFATTFFQAFTPDRSAMLKSIIDAARFGGDFALAGPRGEGKALALDTKLVTPAGFTTMGEVRVGDTLIDKEGRPTKVTFATGIQHNRECFRVTLTDGSEFTADADHQWLVNQRDIVGQKVTTTKKMRDRGLFYGKGHTGHRFTIDVAGEIKTKSKRLPMDPYVFGCWLGDGSTDGNEFTTADEDRDHFVGEFERAGFSISKNSRRKAGANCSTFCFGLGSTIGTKKLAKINRAIDDTGTVADRARRHGIPSATLHQAIKIGKRKTSAAVTLREMGARGTKAIPSDFLWGSAPQRLALLQGLLDTDGSISERGQVEFANKRRHIVDAVIWLVNSLGGKANQPREKIIKGESYYRITFTAHRQVFRLPRKAARVKHRRPLPIGIASIEPVDSVPVRCIQVDAPSETFLIGDRGIVTHNTRLAMYGGLYLMFAQLSTFPMIIGKSQTKAQNELKTIKERLQQNEMLIADFPEIGVPFKAVGAWSSRARMQTCARKSTNIEIAADHLIFPTITREQLGEDWPDDCEPVSKGQIFSSVGVDGPIRGTNYRDERPTLALMDDIENKETADSDTSIEKNEDIIEKDIGGLGGSGRRVSRVMLCTTQNRKCIAYKYTDRKQKPSWKGRRFRKMITPPDHMTMWDEYIEKRQSRADDDPDARAAFRYYRDNREMMDLGAVISNPYSFDKREAEDGEQIEISAIQAYYNRVADFGAEAVATEDDNDPPESIGPQGNGLTPAIVCTRQSGLDRLQIPGNATTITYGIDLGKYRCHWVGTAWWKGAGGVVFDYGVAEVYGTDTAMDADASIPMIYRALVNWRDELAATKIVDATGTERKIDATFVDSGTYTDAAYTFCREVGGTFHPSKGVGRYKSPKASDTILPANHLHASFLAQQKQWLWLLDTDHWKQWVHERFMTPTFDEDNLLRRGSLSIFQPGPGRRHMTFAQHICAEELLTEFKVGKGTNEYWHVHNKNNHWLDALYNAAAAAGGHGIELLSGPAIKLEAKQKGEETAKKRKKQNARRPNHGRRFKSRAGGWVKRER